MITICHYLDLFFLLNVESIYDGWYHHFQEKRDPASYKNIIKFIKSRHLYIYIKISLQYVLILLNRMDIFVDDF